MDRWFFFLYWRHLDGSTIEEHNRRIRDVFDRGSQLNIKFNREKLQLALKKIQFLGHIITSEGIDKSKVRTIQNIEKPNSIKNAKIPWHW